LLDKINQKHPLNVDRYVVSDPTIRQNAQAALLQQFNNPDYHWSLTPKGDDTFSLDMILQRSLTGDKRPLATDLLHRLQTSKEHIFVIGVSGGGKTSSIVDVANHHYVIYIVSNQQ
jgi:signal recognition particle GTPase